MVFLEKNRLFFLGIPYLLLLPFPPFFELVNEGKQARGKINYK